MCFLRDFLYQTRHAVSISHGKRRFCDGENQNEKAKRNKIKLSNLTMIKMWQIEKAEK